MLNYYGRNVGHEFDKQKEAPFINKRYEHAPHLHVPSHGEKVWPRSSSADSGQHTYHTIARVQDRVQYSTTVLAGTFGPEVAWLKAGRLLSCELWAVACELWAPLNLNNINKCNVPACQLRFVSYSK